MVASIIMYSLSGSLANSLKICSKKPRSWPNYGVGRNVNSPNRACVRQVQVVHPRTAPLKLDSKAMARDGFPATIEKGHS
jgi:hypothetical protein